MDGSMAMATQAESYQSQHEALHKSLTTPERIMTVCDVCGVFINSTDNDQRRQVNLVKLLSQPSPHSPHPCPAFVSSGCRSRCSAGPASPCTCFPRLLPRCSANYAAMIDVSRGRLTSLSEVPKCQQPASNHCCLRRVARACYLHHAYGPIATQFFVVERQGDSLQGLS